MGRVEKFYCEIFKDDKVTVNRYSDGRALPKEEKDALMDAFHTLGDKPRYVLARSFGLFNNGSDPWTVDQIARELGLTKSSVRNTKDKALKQLRKLLEEEKPA